MMNGVSIMPKPVNRWQETPGITKGEVAKALATLLGIPADSLVSWAIIVHVHDDTQHNTQIASSHDDPDHITSQLLQGFMAL